MNHELPAFQLPDAGAFAQPLGDGANHAYKTQTQGESNYEGDYYEQGNSVRHRDGLRRGPHRNERIRRSGTGCRRQSTHPHHRGRGIGTALLQRITERLDVFGVYLSCAPSMRGFYEARGFSGVTAFCRRKAR